MNGPGCSSPLTSCRNIPESASSERLSDRMTGWFELRVDGPGRHHYRLYCLLDHDAKGVDKPLLVVIDGRDKAFRTTLTDADYAAVRRLGEEYRRRNPRSLA